METKSNQSNEVELKRPRGDLLEYCWTETLECRRKMSGYFLGRARLVANVLIVIFWSRRQVLRDRGEGRKIGEIFQPRLVMFLLLSLYIVYISHTIYPSDDKCYSYNITPCRYLLNTWISLQFHVEVISF